MKNILIELKWHNTSLVYDVDLVVFGLNKFDRVVSDKYFIFYNQLNEPEGAIKHLGDNDTSENTQVFESVSVDMSALNENVETLVACAVLNTDDEDHCYGKVDKLRVENTYDGKSALIDLANDYTYERELIVFTATRQGDSWEFSSLPRESQCLGLAHLCRKFGVRI